MKPFHAIAIPDKDILEGRLTMDVFAADLWETYQGRGHKEYRDADLFFRRTYLTQGLQNLLSIVEKRLAGRGGDPFIRIQTPFGGGKTHTLIALFHKTQVWKAKKVVVSGTALNPKETLWGLMEKQLTGRIQKFSDPVSPGKEAIRELLVSRQPVLILMDEVLEYVTKASGVKVEESTLAAQTIAFIQELTETVSTLDKTCLVVTLPSSVIEHYDDRADKLFQQLQKVSGRTEKIYTPVQDEEITRIIGRRIFSRIDEEEAKKVVLEFLDYAERESLLPPGVQPSEYRAQFMASYPFLPEVIDVLYHRWGSFPTFQRTRGVLRLLSLVIHSLKESNQPYITLADFDLARQEIRQELVKHIGMHYNGIIDADITGEKSNARKVNSALGKAYQGLNLGCRAATTIFMHSFSGGQDHGLNMVEIKRQATTMENPSSVVAEAADQLTGKLFYLQSFGDKYYFSNQPNLNSIRLAKMENIKNPEIQTVEKDLLKSNLAGGKLKTFIWEETPGNIADTEDLKLVVIKNGTLEVIDSILKTKGQTPRVFRNTIFFLYPHEMERPHFEQTVRQKLACEAIEEDKTLNLSEDQRKKNRQELKKSEDNLKEAIRRLYRTIAVPVKDGTNEIDLGIPTFGEVKALDQEIYEKLRTGGEILEKVAPLVLKEKFLANRDYVLTDQVYQSSMKTPGETRFFNRAVLEQGISEGVRSGLFGLGELEENRPVCRFFKDKELPSVALSGKEIMITEAICREQQKKEEEQKLSVPYPGPGGKPEPPKEADSKKTLPRGQVINKVGIKFELPKGKVSNIMGTLNYLQSKFNKLEITIKAEDGQLTEQEYEDKIEEAFTQSGIDVEDID